MNAASGAGATVRFERSDGRLSGGRARCPTVASSAVRIAALLWWVRARTTRLHRRLSTSATHTSTRISCGGGVGGTYSGTGRRASGQWGAMARGHAPGRSGKITPDERVVTFVYTFAYSHFSSRGTAAMRGRLHATQLLAILLGLLLATTSAQENHQDTAGVPEGFEADTQAARDAEAYLTPDEKSVIQIGNDLLRGNDTILDREDYDVDAVRTRASVSLISHAHVSSALDYFSEHFALARHTTSGSNLSVFGYSCHAVSQFFGEPS